MNSKSAQPLRRQRARGHRWLWIALLTLCAIGAAAVVRRLVVLAAPVGISDPAGLDAPFAAKAGLTLLHIVPSLLFVLLVPLQFVASLRERRPRLHRLTGRVILVCGIVAGVSALALSAHPVGGIVESAATTLFGCLFLFSLGKAWWHIRHRRVELHREWVTRMAAIALGVSTTRPIMGVFFATRPLTGLTPEQFFGPAMWLGFVSTFLAGEAWIRYRRARSARSSASWSAVLFPAVRH
jgi:Predicted membrane protein (DUF2306)